MKSKNLNVLVDDLKKLTGDEALFLEKSNGWYKLVYIRELGTRHDACGCSIHRPKASIKENIKGLINGIVYQRERSIKDNII